MDKFEYINQLRIIWLSGGGCEGCPKAAKIVHAGVEQAVRQVTQLVGQLSQEPV